ncbi:hypothetical protein BH11MYX2_BH11MYX2_31140 [soil metagenome]
MARKIGKQVGDTPLAKIFYAGRYAEVVARSFDTGNVGAADVAFAVGALTFLDRVDEAQAAFEGAKNKDARTIAACRFFLGLAASRAGYFDRGSLLLVREAFSARHDEDPWIRALVFQGLAAQCYFTGRYRGAAAHALRALQAAHEAKFLWAAMLGTDMRAHSLVQMGQLQRGIAMLEQAGRQAQRLGMANNAFAVETSIATYVTRFSPTPDALARIESLLEQRSHDSYSRRALLTEAAVQRALRGRRDEAVEAIEAADKDALRGDTRRGRASSLLARLWVTRWRYGAAACAELVEAARELIEPRDVTFRAELLGFDVLVARALGDEARARKSLDALRELWRTTHHFAAKAALGQFEMVGATSAFEEDALAPVLRAVAQHDATALSRIVGQGLHGALPELLGLAPGKRIVLIPGEDLVLLEDHGNVLVRQRPPRWCPVLLRILASGDSSKERIVEGLWGLKAYHPEIHDPPVRTTIHRLRSFLQPYGNWIEVGDAGYRTTVPVHLISSIELPEEKAPLWEEGEVPSLDLHREPRARRHDALHRDDRIVQDDDRSALVLSRLTELDHATVPQLAKSLELSASTVLRALRDLVDDKRVERLGFARATRYRARR